jgi:hypothetical protein
MASLPFPSACPLRSAFAPCPACSSLLCFAFLGRPSVLCSCPLAAAGQRREDRPHKQQRSAEQETGLHTRQANRQEEGGSARGCPLRRAPFALPRPPWQREGRAQIRCLPPSLLPSRDCARSAEGGGGTYAAPCITVCPCSLRGALTPWAGPAPLSRRSGGAATRALFSTAAAAPVLTAPSLSRWILRFVFPLLLLLSAPHHGAVAAR